MALWAEDEEEAIREGRVVAFHIDASGIEYAFWKGYGMRPNVHFFEDDIKNTQLVKICK